MVGNLGLALLSARLIQDLTVLAHIGEEITTDGEQFRCLFLTQTAVLAL
jgi:hypothetical protein